MRWLAILPIVGRSGREGNKIVGGGVRNQEAKKDASHSQFFVGAKSGGNWLVHRTNSWRRLIPFIFPNCFIKMRIDSEIHRAVYCGSIVPSYMAIYKSGWF
jgi:hypothetical protein